MISSHVMADDPSISPEDKDLFRQSVGSVKAVKHDQADSRRPRPASAAAQKRSTECQKTKDSLSDHLDSEEIKAEDNLQFARPGIQKKLFRKLRRGEFNIEAELDLHGLIVDQARTALIDFINKCQQADIRNARIIHGKGYGSEQQQPRLKGLTNHWLKQLDSVLAFCSAQPADGGTGAVYVLLKRAQK